jgi:tRNA A-37 threonylcarbamoyl transferase component Bud32
MTFPSGGSPSWALQGYTEIRRLGSGASGRVVLARHDATGTDVAIKYLSEHLLADADALTSFREEARLVAALDEPEIAKLYEYVETDLGSALVLELVDGVTLRAMLAEHGALPVEAALVVLSGSLRGLAAAHARSVVHRDYKPENVLIDREGRSKLVDFGVATRSGMRASFAGTALYMAPEQWIEGVSSPASDVYSATVTFVECVTGQSLYSGGSPYALEQQHLHAEPDLTAVPEGVRDVVGAGLEKDPAQRPSDAAALEHRLAGAAQTQCGSDWRERGRRQLARRAALLALLFPRPDRRFDEVARARTVLGMRRAVAVSAGVALLVLASGGIAAARTFDGSPAALTRVTHLEAAPTTRATPPGPLAAATAPPSGPASPTPTGPVSAPTSGPTSLPTAAPPLPVPTAGPAASAAPDPTGVTLATVTSFGQTDGTGSSTRVTVRTTGPGPVVLSLHYNRYPTKGGTPVPDGASSRSLSGARSYTITDSHSFSSCAEYWGVVASTTPAAANGSSSQLSAPSC